MTNCPNCGAELAPSVLSCGHCRMPLPPEHRTAFGMSSGVGSPAGPPSGPTSGPPPQSPATGPYGQSEHTVIRPGTGGGYQPGQGSQWRHTSDPIGRGGTAGSPPSGHLPPVAPEPEFDPRERRQRRNTIAMVVLASVVLAIALVSGLVVVLSLSGEPTTGESAGPTLPASAPPSSAAPPPPAPSSSSAAPTPSASTPTPTPTPQKGPTTTAADAQTCAPGLQVPAKGTSCEFAREVAKQVEAADPKAEEFTVKAHSPVTKKDYEMSCVRNSVLTTCTGGNNAVVWIHN